PSTVKSPAARKAENRLSSASARAKPWSEATAIHARPGASFSAVSRTLATTASSRSSTASVSAVHGAVSCWGWSREIRGGVREFGPLLLEEPYGEAAAELVGVDVEEPRVRADLRLELGQEAGRRDRAQELGVVRSAGAPELGDVPVGVEAHRHRPLDARRAETGPRGSVPERGHANVLGVPVPARLVRAERVERRVGEDAVSARPDPGDERGVARIGHGGNDPDHALGVRPFLHEAPELGDLEPARVGGGDVVGPESVDRDQDDERRSALALGEAEG